MLSAKDMKRHKTTVLVLKELLQCNWRQLHDEMLVTLWGGQ